MAQIAAGKGKSYVTALTIAFLITRKATQIEHYIIAFHCQEILAKEQAFYDKLFTNFGGYSHSLVATPEALATVLGKVDKRRTLVIHDEADWWWLDACIPVDRQALCLGLSATSYGAAASIHSSSLEAKLLDQQGVYVKDVNMKNDFPLEHSVKEYATAKQWLAKEVNTLFDSVLIYCTTDLVSELK